jgi:bifunctional DNA-binding transcriptional regulator/antitoxin component of YhaV-PrlF toxin-antitoxin module
MPTMTLTAKRQATLPLETCKALGLQPGDVVELEARDGADGRVWVLRPRPSRARRWLGSLAAYGGAATDHSMEAVRASVATGRKRAGGK